MTVVFRADANGTLGTGHVMRCMGLAMRLQTDGIDSLLVSESLPEPLRNWLRRRNLAFRELADIRYGGQQSDAEQTAFVIQQLNIAPLLVVDHYGLGYEWENYLSGLVSTVWAIDDLANREHDCRVLIDPGLHPGADERYRHLVPQDCVQLLGPTYAFLRPEFDRHVATNARDGSLTNLLIYLGAGSAIETEITKVLEAVRRIDHAPDTTVLLGLMPDATGVADRLERAYPEASILESTDSTAALFDWADLCIGTSGFAAWERCSLGLPTFTVLIAENQLDDAVELHNAGATWHLGVADVVTTDDWYHALTWAVQNPDLVSKMSLKAEALVPGWSASRETILDLIHGA